MSRGRPSLPDSVKKLRGTDQPCRMSGNADTLVTISSLPPAGKKFNKTQRKLYKEIGAALIAQNMLTPTNIYQFVAYCKEMGNYIDAEEKLSNLTDRIHEMNSQVGYYTKVSALHRISKEALDKALKLGNEFGFTPASAKRLSIETKGKKESDDDFIKYLKS